jgi:hypothetical protein
MEIYQDDSGWRVGDGVNQVSQVFPSEEAAKKYLDKRIRSQASFDRAMKYPGKIIPVEWLKENIEADEQTEVCPYCKGANMDLDGDSGGGCTHCFNGRLPKE